QQCDHGNIRQEGAGVNLPPRINESEIPWHKRLAEVKPHGPTRPGQPRPEPAGLDDLASDGAVVLKPDCHQPQREGKGKKGKGPQQVTANNAPALPPRASEENEGEHDGGRLA